MQQHVCVCVCGGGGWGVGGLSVGASSHYQHLDQAGEAGSVCCMYTFMQSALGKGCQLPCIYVSAVAAEQYWEARGRGRKGTGTGGIAAQQIK
jgi:hypothetical protein